MTVYSASDWSVKCKLTPPTESETTKVLALQYGRIRNRGKLGYHSFLLVSNKMIVVTCSELTDEFVYYSGQYHTR